MNAGTVAGVVVTTIFTDPYVAHSPAFGVNLYVAVPALTVLITVGFQVPEIPLAETRGSAGATLF